MYSVSQCITQCPLLHPCGYLRLTYEYTHIHMHTEAAGCLIFMVCSITYHYKYLLWFTLLSGSFSPFSLVLSLPYPGDFRHQQLLVSAESLWSSLFGFPKICLLSFLIYCMPSVIVVFSPFLRFTIRLLMVFRCCIDSLRVSLSASAWITLCLALSTHQSLRGYVCCAGLTCI